MQRKSLVVAGVAGALLTWSALDDKGLRQHLRLQGEVRAVADRNEALRQENLRLKREARALAGDPAALERAAREELNYVRPGEVVIRLEEGNGR
ncbi:MAG TPA: septum formation initiator family protein [Anaeromyxobacteraceae bacterium]|nr:septum formation initiator family protein [Anaeromyxobacteraceae bacterium]